MQSLQADSSGGSEGRNGRTDDSAAAGGNFLDMFDVVCSNCFLPEFWVTQYPSSDNYSDGEPAVGCCHHLKLKSMSSGSGKQYNVLAPEGLSNVRGDDQCAKLRPASTYFCGYLRIEFGKAFVRGGYTHDPSLHAHGARSILAELIQGRVFFAGEATHPGVNPCMQAAIDTGRRAVREILHMEVHSRM